MRNKKKIAIVLTFIMLFTFIKIDYADAIAPAIPVGVYYVIAGLLTAAGLSVAVGDHEALQVACEKFWDYSQHSQRQMIYTFYNKLIADGTCPISDSMWNYIDDYLNTYYSHGDNEIIISSEPVDIQLFDKYREISYVDINGNSVLLTIGISGSRVSFYKNEVVIGNWNYWGDVEAANNAFNNAYYYGWRVYQENGIDFVMIARSDKIVPPEAGENLIGIPLLGSLGYLEEQEYLLNYNSELGDFVNESAPDGFIADRRIAFEQQFLNSMDLQAALSSWTGQNVEDIRNNLAAYIATTTVWQGDVQNDINEQTTSVVGALSSIWELVNRGFGSIAQGLRWLLDKLAEIANFLNPASDTFFLRTALVPDVAVLNGFVESLNINFQEKFQIAAAYEEFQSYKDTDHESEFEDIYVDLPIWGMQCICKGEFINTAGQQFKSVVAAFLILLTVIFCFKRIATIGSK
ncbi:MAG: hypothetical protein GX660_28740 [Clostridiaceae bacterium]|nr:hypothetical protein [Clostridiaceae bacterium]